MGPRTRSALLWCGLFLMVPATGSCGGEITAVTLGNGRQASFERFRDEVQPALQAQLVDGDMEAGVGLRDCTAIFCHGSDNGVGAAEDPTPLRLVANPDEAQIIENFRQATTRINLDDPEGSVFLTDPLTTTPHGGLKNFRDTNDCCYLIVLNWIKDEPAPECTCPSP